MQPLHETDRLILTPLNTSDDEFILELVNTPQWIQFIGDRKIASAQDAVTYIRKILDAPAIRYWVVKLKDGATPVGIITFIKKDYLPHHDLGFAFLPRYNKQGYAFESAKKILTDILNEPAHKKVLATCKEGNINSIRLLEKLGFEFESEMTHGEDVLMVFAVQWTL